MRQVPAPHAVCRQIPAQSGEARLRHRIFLNCLAWLSAPLSVLLPTPSVGDGRPILGSRAPCPVPVVGWATTPGLPSTFLSTAWPPAAIRTSWEMALGRPQEGRGTLAGEERGSHGDEAGSQHHVGDPGSMCFHK